MFGFDETLHLVSPFLPFRSSFLQLLHDGLSLILCSHMILLKFRDVSQCSISSRASEQRTIFPGMFQQGNSMQYMHV